MEILEYIWTYLWPLIPTTVLGIVFWMVLRGVYRTDQKEREVYEKMEQEMRAERASKQQ
ncbi:MAG: hypothetical protein KF916_03010 [Microbacteriaceae bacterium]|jgi:hypothetical protein|nr:hypothetical protein [Microbacteriaceae bacterium]